MKKTLSALASALLLFIFYAAVGTFLEPPQARATVNEVAGIPYYLYGSGAAAADTTVTLTSFKQPVSQTPLTITDFGDTGYITLEPGNTTRQEFISFTGVTQNSDGTATLTGVTRGLGNVSPYTASSTLRKAHGGGTSVVVSNSPQFYQRFAKKASDETITGTWSIIYPTASSSPASKGYVDTLAFGGTTSNDRLVVAATAGETVVIGEILYFDTIQDEWMKADASVAASSTQVLLGVAQGAGTNGNTIAGGVLLAGLDTTNTNGTAGNPIYISDTAGATSTTAGTVSKQIGIIRNSAGLYFEPYIDFPTLGATQTWTGLNTFTATTTFSGANGGFDVTATSTALIGDFPAWEIGKQRQVFSTTGTTTFSVPSGVKRVYVEAIGGGASGGGANANGESGTGGGAGGYANEVVDVSATTSVQVHVGTAGLWSTFGTYGFYLKADPGTVGNDPSSSTAGGAGGCGSGGDVNTCGGPGDNAGTTLGIGAGGGSVYFGGGVAGRNGAGDGPACSVGSNGSYGGGGAGGVSSGAGNNGGTGCQGLVIVRW